MHESLVPSTDVACPPSRLVSPLCALARSYPRTVADPPLDAHTPSHTRHQTPMHPSSNLLMKSIFSLHIRRQVGGEAQRRRERGRAVGRQVDRELQGGRE
eukprot:362855-Chlamydomonas_euryale.AAC.10